MRKRRFERINLKLVSMIILIILLFIISIGYSVLRQRLNIYGRSTIVVTEKDNLNTNEKGDY